jgi:hypothetical protein
MIGIKSPSLNQGNTSFLPCNDPPTHEYASSTIPVVLPGSNRDTVLKSLGVLPVPLVIAKSLIVRHHYLHSFPGGTMLTFGVFVGKSLLGAIALGAGPFQGHCLVRDAKPENCITLTRLWVADELPTNTESYILGSLLRNLRLYTHLKFVIAYSDPSVGHFGTIYQATNWLYTGLSSAMPLYDCGDGRGRYSRSIAQILGSHSIKHFAIAGIPMILVQQNAKYRYIYFLDPKWRSQLEVPVLPYPKGVKNVSNY